MNSRPKSSGLPASSSASTFATLDTRPTVENWSADSTRLALENMLIDLNTQNDITPVSVEMGIVASPPSSHSPVAEDMSRRDTTMMVHLMLADLDNASFQLDSPMSDQELEEFPPQKADSAKADSANADASLSRPSDFGDSSLSLPQRRSQRDSRIFKGKIR